MTMKEAEDEEDSSGRRRFVFDHLWGIPGDTEDTQLRILHQLARKQVIFTERVKQSIF